MKTINKIGGVNGLSYTEFYGNSTDIKPTDDTIPNGSVFYEIDRNMQEYRWDKENFIWRKISSTTSGGGGSATGDYLPLSGGTMSGSINMDGYQVENVSELSLGETGYVGIIPHETTSDTDSGTTIEISNPKTKKDIKLRGIDTPVNDNDAVNKKYTDDIKEYGIEHNPVLDSGQEEFIVGQKDLAYVFKNSMVLDSGDRFYFADPVSLTDGKLVPFMTSAMTSDDYHLLVGTYPKGVENGTLSPVQIDGIAEPTGDNMAVNKKYVDDLVGQGGGNYIPLFGTLNNAPVTGRVVWENNWTEDTGQVAGQWIYVVSNEIKGNYWLAESEETVNNPTIDNYFRLGYDSLSFTGLKDNKLKTVYIRPNMDKNAIQLSDNANRLQDHPILLKGVNTPVDDTDAVNKQYVDNITKNQVTIQKADNPDMCINLTIDGDEASGVLDLTDKNGNPIVLRGVDTPIQDTDAVNKKFLEDSLKNASGGTIGEYVPTKDLDMKQHKLINTSAVEIFGGINDSEDNSYFIRETSQASINTSTSVPEYVKVITGVHTGDTNQDVILRGIRAGQQKNDAVNYGQLKTLADSFDRCQQDVEALNEWKMTFDEHAVENTVNSIIKYTDQSFDLNITSTTKDQWFSYDLAMQSGYTPVSATLVIDDDNPFVGYCSLDITPDGTYNALIYLKATGSSTSTSCKVRLVWIKNPTVTTTASKEE